MFLAIFCPPLYFLLQKKWGMFALTGFMALISFGLMVIVPVPLTLWLISAVLGIYHCKRAQAEKFAKQHAADVGRAVAAELAKHGSRV